MEFKVRRFSRKIHYRFNVHGVCRRYTSMRNPLQAAKRCSCGCNCMREQRSAKRDLHILMTANGISPPSGNRPLHPCPPTAAPLRGLQWVSHRGPVSRNPQLKVFLPNSSGLQTRLLLVVKKASFDCKQGFFWLQTRLVFNPYYLWLLSHWYSATCASWALPVREVCFF